jgi:Mor family transcriptional regulator
MKESTVERNREIFDDARAGKSREQLADQYGLALATIANILLIEKNRRLVSNDAYYRNLRVLSV